jgi:hypothetical protein
MSDCAAEENSERALQSLDRSSDQQILRVLALKRRLGRENQGNNYILDEQRSEDMSQVANRALLNRSFPKI